jgi:hypothetical protein
MAEVNMYILQNKNKPYNYWLSLRESPAEFNTIVIAKLREYNKFASVPMSFEQAVQELYETDPCIEWTHIGGGYEKRVIDALKRIGVDWCPQVKLKENDLLTPTDVIIAIESLRDEVVTLRAENKALKIGNRALKEDLQALVASIEDAREDLKRNTFNPYWWSAEDV